MSITLPMDNYNSPEDIVVLSDEQISARIAKLKKKLEGEILVLGHHYQRDSIIQHADLVGDSFLLSKMAAESKAKHIIFCGVHFMAESADILTRRDQKIVLPNLRAGCSMADMANLNQVEACWYEILEKTKLLDPIERDNPDSPASNGNSYLIPVTYMNSAANLKAFVGKHGGIVCTSSNASGVLKWAFERAGNEGKILFFPDQHLGRNTGNSMGFKETEMVVWDPEDVPPWNLIFDARIILWHGYCSVHRRFKVEQITEMRKKFPEAKVVVHPECSEDVVASADACGSTEFIKEYVNDAPVGSIIGVGTEINMVKRLDSDNENKQIYCLDSLVCPCSTMYMIHPRFLLEVLEQIDSGNTPNQIVVQASVASNALVALERMLSIPL